MNLLRSVARKLQLKKLEDRVRHHRQRFEAETRRVLGRSAYLTIHTQDSARRLETLGPSSSGIAVVSALPPDDTGVATFGYRLAADYPGYIDLFGTFKSVSDYQDMCVRLYGTAELFPLELLGQAALRRNYHTIIFAIANSNHIVPIADRLRSLTNLDIPSRIIAEVHDPVLFNLSRQAFKTIAESDAAYARAYPRLGGAKFSAADDEQLLGLGISGFSALFRNVADAILVHSQAAREILAADMSEIDPLPIYTLFHPVFRQAPMRRSVGDRQIQHPALGCFGVPAPDKHIDEVIAAGRSMLDRKIVASVVIAGFDTHRIAARVEDVGSEGFVLVNAPDDGELTALMKEVDVAIQLRRRNLGESSGIVAQLVELSKPIVTSRLGSFLDYNGLVTFCDDPVSVDSIEAAVVDALGQPEAHAFKMRSYTESHRVADFFDGVQRLNSENDFGDAGRPRSIQRVTTNPVDVIGYYNHYNAGDDAFALYFRRVFGSSLRLHGKRVDDGRIRERAILGAGALVNQYFIDQLPDFRMLDVIGCSLPGASSIALLQKFRERLGLVALRGAKDTALAQEHGIAAETCPDIVFGLEEPAPSMTLRQVRSLAQLPTHSGIAEQTIVLHLSDDYATRQWQESERRDEIELFKTELASGLDELVNGYNVVHVPMSAGYNARDIAFAHDVVARMRRPEKVTFIERYLGPLGIMRITASVADVVLSMKFHGLVFGMLCGKPVINLGDNPKTVDLMNESDLGAFDIGIREFTRDGLLDAVGATPHVIPLINEIRVRNRLAVNELGTRLRCLYLPMREQ